MTINVVIKCPDGIVMGADSLVTIQQETGEITSIVPYFTKLFEIKRFAAAAMINGRGSIGGRTLEDILSEFGEVYSDQDPENYSLEELVKSLGRKIQQVIREDYGLPITLEVIIGGYSKGKKAKGKRFGEIYSIKWDESAPRKSFSPQFSKMYKYDREFGRYYGGQVDMPDRFLYGVDNFTLIQMWQRRERLFRQCTNYLIEELRKKGIKVPKDTSLTVPGLAGFNIYNLFADYEITNVGSENLERIKKGMVSKLKTMEGYFSLQTAVNYCSFLMWCAYAQNTFTLTIPAVGSEMRVASITRNEGFNLIKKWEIQSPGPPFR